jgi:hypothetical protein
LGSRASTGAVTAGYDFSLTPAADILELSLKTTSAEELGQLPDDLSFLDPNRPSEPVRFSGSMKADSSRAAAAAPAPAFIISAELPLFGATLPDDLPLITKPSAPRPPLAVRRATPELPRLRGESARAATLDLGLEPAALAPTPRVAPRSSEAPTMDAAEDAGHDATIGARFAAFVTDMLILAAIDVAVVHLTLQICGIGLKDLSILPWAPLSVFLLVQNGGYLVTFTAGGQTIGKMAAGIKVVSAEPRFSLDFGRACVRGWCGSRSRPAGLGLHRVEPRSSRCARPHRRHSPCA